jgi:hypothetical protein
MPIPQASDDEFALSLVRHDLLFRLQQRIGLIPPNGLGLARRAIFWSLLAWVPLLVWAVMKRRVVAGAVDEPLLMHFAVQARLMIAVPIMILGEGLTHQLMMRLLPEFVRSGLVPEAERPRFREVLSGIARLRDSTLPWLGILVLVLTIVGAGATRMQADELSWAIVDPGRSSLGFGGWWLVLVGRPIFVLLALAWLWRLVLLFLLFRRIVSLPLDIAPTHADRAGGLGFLRWMPQAFSPVIFALAVVLAATWGHEVYYHGTHVTELQPLMAAFLVVVLLLFTAPYLAFVPALTRAKRAALLEYGALLGRHGTLVRRRWILGQAVADDPVLSAPELGPVADINGLYDSVERMKPVPLGLASIAMVAVPAALPLLPVIAIEVPIRELLGGLAKALL